MEFTVNLTTEQIIDFIQQIPNATKTISKVTLLMLRLQGAVLLVG